MQRHGAPDFQTLLLPPPPSLLSCWRGRRVDVPCQARSLVALGEGGVEEGLGVGLAAGASRVGGATGASSGASLRGRRGASCAAPTVTAITIRNDS